MCFFAKSIGCATELLASTGTGGCLDTGQFIYQKGTTVGSSLGNGHIENWGESGSAMADNSQQTDTSTDVDTDEKNQVSCLFLGHSLCMCFVFDNFCFLYIYVL